jgi:hypothetical protein
MNGRNPAMEEVAQRYVVKHPGKIRLMGDGSNRGIARAMVAMTEAAKGPYFLFMERDFQLVEPGTCVEEQLSAGVELLAGGAGERREGGTVSLWGWFTPGLHTLTFHPLQPTSYATGTGSGPGAPTGRSASSRATRRMPSMAASPTLPATTSE